MLSNRVAVIAGVCGLGFVGVFPLLGMYALVVSLGFMILGCGLTLWFNAQGEATLARAILVPFLSLHVTFVDYAMIECESPRVFLFPLAVLGFLIFDQKERLWAVGSGLFAVACFLFITSVTSHQRVGLYHVSPDVLPYLDLAVVSACLLASAAVLVSALVGNVKATR